MLIVNSLFVEALVISLKVQSLNRVFKPKSIKLLLHFNFPILLGLKLLQLLECFFFLLLQLKINFFLVLLDCLQCCLRNYIL